jgi:hypothetical protein
MNEHAMSPGHETRDVNYRGILAVAGFIIVIAAFIHIGVWLFFAERRERIQERMKPAFPLATQEQARLPKPPRLEGVESMEGQRTEPSIIQQRPRSFGWVDRKAGIARIPIERAFQIIVEKKMIASRNETPAPDLKHPYAGMPSPANSGRSIEKDQP